MFNLPFLPSAKPFIQAGANYCNGNNYKKQENKLHVIMKNNFQDSKSSR